MLRRVPCASDPASTQAGHPLTGFSLRLFRGGSSKDELKDEDEGDENRPSALPSRFASFFFLSFLLFYILGGPV